MPELKLGLNDKALFEAQGRAGPKKAVELEVSIVVFCKSECIQLVTGPTAGHQVPPVCEINPLRK
jgi:hypothetical protein